MDEHNEHKREPMGQEFARWLKPGGCILLLLIMILVIVTCFISGRDPIPGYKAPHDSQYYAVHIDELQAELEANVFPIIGDVAESHVEGDKLSVTLESATFAVTRSAILRYYDADLFEFSGTSDNQ